ncbi:hypothetical protein CNY89_13200 [Amaricoccus sp. HAR-UPW-R2A-40]|nr:hypothetical protein CNY89_13200 [Amaricoccus sp. HAR-UPW-R2A-40]
MIGAACCAATPDGAPNGMNRNAATATALVTLNMPFLPLVGSPCPTAISDLNSVPGAARAGPPGVMSPRRPPP